MSLILSCLTFKADGGNYCACVNAATLALIDAGIPLVDYVSACTASLVTKQHLFNCLCLQKGSVLISTQVADTPLVDVSSLEATTGGPELTVAAHPKSGQIVLLEMSHRFHLDHLDKVMEVALAGCRDIHTILDAAVRSHVARTGAQLGWKEQG